ncbi:phosphatidylethanolamine N-methyltransferase [Phlyctochytrium planicorne]|nr:phosphatidylethanolamine N-methyltransferase [Phlyctochytrium planicorne]
MEPEDGKEEENEVEFTWGRTFKGQVFQVPQTQDVFYALFYPSTPQSVFEWSILSILGLELALLLLGTTDANQIVFMNLFIFWRLMYNLGLGILLMLQSKHAFLVRWAKKLNIGGRQQRKRGPWIEFFVGELKKKIGLVDESFESLPAEFTTWILFRGLVDLIIVNDTACYLFFVWAHFDIPAQESLGWTDFLRYVAGSILVIFGWWVRLDARREIKDFAWYWGDFFFLIGTSPTFSGVYEMAPHPMYSVGYIGFYGAALITKSYTVLFVSLGAHIAQLLFLFFVENPHLEKVYRNPANNSEDSQHDKRILQNYFQRDLIILRNFDWFRSTDLFTVGTWLYTLATAVIIGPIGDNQMKLYFYLGQAVFWRFSYNWVLGLVLHLQSTSKFWSRHFIKYGETTKEAFHQWKIIFNMCQSMTYITFFICACHLYTVPENWFYGTVLLKHTVALITICLHIWTAISIHNALGDFGWFYGDFFIEGGAFRDRSRLTYTGVYRFLNHPNAWAATASAWGITWACGSWALMWLTIFGQASNWLFVRYVELPHMKRKYGTRVRAQEEAGMPKALREGVGRIEGRAKEVIQRMGGRFGSLRRVMSASGIWDRGDGDEKDDGDNDNGSEDSFESSLRLRRTRSSSGGEILSQKSQSGAKDVDDDDGAFIFGSSKRSASVDDSEGRQESEATKGSSGKGFSRRQGLPFRLSRPTSFSETMKVAVSRTKPRVNQIVEDAKMIVTKRVERLASVTQRSLSPLIQFPLYTLTFPAFDEGATSPTSPSKTQSSHPIITFRLGEPIHIRFTCARETLKRLDWIGIYGASHNLSSEITTSRNSLWIFVTGMWKREDDEDPSKPLLRRIGGLGGESRREESRSSSPSSSDDEKTGVDDASINGRDDNDAEADTKPKRSASVSSMQSIQLTTKMMLGTTPVTVCRSKDDAGLRVVTGTLKFYRSRIPWKVGAYEARYHLDGTYSVLAISQIFEIVAEPFDWSSHGDESSLGEHEPAKDGGLLVALESLVFGGVDPLRSHPGQSTAEDKTPAIVIRVIQTLRDYVERCVDIDPNDEDHFDSNRRLSVDEDILERCVLGEDTPDTRSFTKYKERVAKRIVYGVRQIFGIDFSWKVVRILGSVRMLARKICEARVALSPVQFMGDDEVDDEVSLEQQDGDDDDE